MEILKKKNGKSTFRARVYINGKRISRTFGTKTLAETWKRKETAERDRNEALGISPVRKITFEEFRDLWNERKFGSLAITTRVRYEGLQRLYISPFFKGKMVREIGRETVENLAVSLRRSDTPAQTIDQVIRLLKTMLTDAVAWDYLNTNPASRFPKQAKQVPKGAYWEEADAEKFLLNRIRDPLYFLYFLALKTGLRRGELAGLTWEAVNFTTNNISVCRVRDRYGERETTKTGERRDVPMNTEVRRVLGELYRGRKAEFVFTRPDGRPVDIQHVYRAFNRAQEEAGIDKRITFHGLRHGFASIFLMRGGNIHALAKAMGHSKVAMTERYGHIAPGHVAREMEKMCSAPENTVNSPYLARAVVS